MAIFHMLVALPHFITPQQARMRTFPSCPADPAITPELVRYRSLLPYGEELVFSKFSDDVKMTEQVRKYGAEFMLAPTLPLYCPPTANAVIHTLSEDVD